ncbi:hypothetical protein [Mammaliicoccus sp. D-M17]|uniref:hypothetical protein n=1 Tax=Mammaliicoccus sp. D-M17 TaxID=2898677 RepID=UPI001EFA6B51|nr:hypothetical protein [Mammaliicoccus sp. D-M17]
MSGIVTNEFEKESLICCLDFMIGLKKEQKKRLKRMTYEEVDHYYKMRYLEHNEGMLQ